MSDLTTRVIQARFNPLIRPYLVIRMGFVMACTIIGLPLALIWIMGAGQWWARHYFHKLECRLDGKRIGEIEAHRMQLWHPGNSLQIA